ncbi:hypothetical protein JCM1840_006042 [Sporobolomyces johnsonii]
MAPELTVKEARSRVLDLICTSTSAIKDDQQEAARLFLRILSSASLLHWLKEVAGDSLDQYSHHVEQDTDKFARDIFANLLTTCKFPLLVVARWVKDLAQVESERARYSVSAGRLALDGGIFIHVDGLEDKDLGPSLKGKKGWIYNTQSRDFDHVITPSSFVVHRYLSLREHPSVNLIFDEGKIWVNGADHWMLEHPSDQPIPLDQLAKLHLSSLHPREKNSLLAFACMDPGRSHCQTTTLVGQLRHSVDMSLNWRKPWTRGADRAATGTATRTGFRWTTEKRPVGSYRNFQPP